MPTDADLPDLIVPSDLRRVIPIWSWAVPATAWLCLSLITPAAFAGWGVAVLGAVLFATVFAAVHHAEVIAHRIGEPFGTLVLALAVTVIEVALIVSIMLSAKGAESSLARDTVFAAVMLACNGVLGICLLVAGIRFGEPLFRARAASSYLAVLAVLATAALVLPEFTHTAPGPVYSPAQLVFVAIVAVVLYGVFLFVQTVRHRDYFLPVGGNVTPDAHAPPPSGAATGVAALLLVVALGAVVLLAKKLSPELEAAMRAAHVAQPAAAVGVIVAALVLLPEAVSAIRAARINRLQTSVNLALGSALASIALTIPAVAAVALWTGQPLELGLGDTGLVFLALTFVVTTMTLSSGRATVLQGAVHLTILALFLFLVIVP
ncbi:calcium:proton antiporter [Glacieibacterium megasporae]|uniref:calcium:proton antiporter n=1 Tax=Glacieibacterium megasporae TaxID=2835787 RepID=UPI001C1DF0D8|nr:ionic transporter y4hA [Polymorphobacter megasporae]UAJ10068.1 ionic transporter y4hA [Polymorphobacter megasporae]